jgi:glycosyltransferase involved in cell wall biosynthesis
LKILHVIPSLAASDGGPSHAVRMMEKALLERGIDVETATTYEGGSEYGGDAARTSPVLEEGVKRWYFRRTANPYKVSIPFSRWIFRHARDYDLIHIHALFSFTSTVAAIAARRARVPYVVRPLGTLSRYGVTQRRPWLKRLSLAVVERGMLRNAAAVHFTSLSEQREAESLGLPMRAVVLPLAVSPSTPAANDILSARFPALRGRQYALYLSRLDPKKNVEGLLAAIGQCAAALPEMRWLIAGEGTAAYGAQLRALATRLGVADRLVWAGHIDGELKVAALAAATLFVLPSFSENFGIAAAEALVEGVPCVLSSGIAIADELADAGAALAVGTDPESIASAMIRLVKDDRLRAGMSVNARNYAQQNFSVATMGRALVKLYGDLQAKARDRVGA